MPVPDRIHLKKFFSLYRVNKHEDKLLNITDELNKTWTFVSTLKHQHRQLHESEQILRAELTEKRHILAKLRKELEYSRYIF